MGTSPVPQGVADELRRVVQRWQQLPLDHALRCVPPVRDVLARLVPLGVTEAAGDRLARGELDGATVPDLGPAVVMDQLTVLVYDACAADSSPARGAQVQALLADLRRALP
ncbi:hypothetical protein [Phycicoccus sp. SLBN-51]|uniref:hypothetical protein n=1 Tax=Phycicoccus sp. SLBN-51 TaxID=2768447 RepID=UPI00115285C4|nr:hypothetical protein [Phycicoccus sp. SLBN-51]TQJ52053.1 hypothetical protein FBY26_3796 [Phycicoccus sp. SLBN-51]